MAQGAPGSFVSRTLAANITAVANSPSIYIGDIDNVTAQIVQRVDDGTVTATVQHSFDGTVWINVGAAAVQTDFAAGADVAVERVLESSNGMPIRSQYMRLSVTVHTGTGEYDLIVGGRRIADII